MEEKKNNAVEKVENAISSSKTKSKNKQPAKSTKKSVKKSKRSGKDEKIALKKKILEQKRAEKLKRRQEAKEHKLLAKAEKEKIRAEKRVELAKIKAHKKAEREKAKATALREKNRRREENIKRKQELKAERIRRREEIKAEKAKRRDMIKNETKKQREKRLQQEKALRLEQKRINKEKKAQLKKEKFLANKQRKEQRLKNRQANKQRNKGFGGWLAAVISLGVATVVLASVLTFTFLMPNVTNNNLESAYSKSFYDTIEQVDNMDLNLSKSLATSDAQAMQKYLVDLAINSELAENNIQQLPLQDENKFYTTKLINQIGDYAKYLNNKLIEGETLTNSEYETLRNLYISNLAFKKTLQSISDQMGNNFSFNALDSEKSNFFTDGFNDLQNLSVEYPELIYDGPFSDGTDDREIKGLYGNTITEKLALQKFKTIFTKYDLDNIRNVGVLEGKIKCFNVQGEKDGDVLFAQISEVDGKLIMFSYAGSCNAKVYEQDAAINNAESFLDSVGIKNVEAVWVNESNNVYTINFATVIDNVVVYPDLIKVRVCAETGMVIGLEATSYYTNHTDRVISGPNLTKAQAIAYVSDNIDVDTIRLAVVPVGQKTEKLCYEFTGTYDGATYYVYIDANTGKQVEMFKVVSGSEGLMLM